MKNSIIALFFIFTLIVPVSAQMKDMPMKGNMHNHKPMRMKGEMMGMSMDMMSENVGACLENAEKIGLTEEQKAKLTPIHRDMMKKQARFKADLKIAEIELMEIMDTKDFDLDKAIAATKKISEIRTNQHMEMLKSMKEVRSILTDEQYKKMKALMMNKKMKPTKMKYKMKKK